jgi:hypothetical protein
MSAPNVREEKGMLEFRCPHCGGGVEVLVREVNCKIFRHAVYIKNGQQIGPHTKKHECDRLVREGLVRGCAKPFRLNRNGPNWYVEVCDYI